jgi:hypothetical protein
MVADAGGHAELVQGFAQNREPALKLPIEDAMRAMRMLDRAPGVLDRRAQVLRCELVLFLFDALAARALEEEADHYVVEEAIDEAIDDASQQSFASELGK